MQFSVRSLLILMAVAAVFTMPIYRCAIGLYERWNAPDPVTNQLPVLATTSVKTVVNVPDGGAVIIGGMMIRPDGSRWVNGRMVLPPKE